MKRFEKFRVYVSVIMAFIFFSSTTLWSAAPLRQDNWTGKIRPGVMAGNKEYETDYTIDYLLPVWANKDSLLFLNPHYRTSDEGTDIIDDSNEFNIGLGFRKLANTASGDIIFGANVFWDFINSRHNNDFYQWGIGVETLSQWVDFRANYYHPYGDTIERVPSLDLYLGGESSLLTSMGYEEALEGFDVELGFQVPGISDIVETRIYGGGYWYNAEKFDDIEGFMARLEVRPIQFINFNIEYKDDNVRNATFIGGYLDIPFSLPNLFSGENPFEGIFETGPRVVAERMTDKIVRDRHIVVEADITKPEIARDEDGNPINMIYVNDDNTEVDATNCVGGPKADDTGFDCGKGTLSDPYENIMDAYTNENWKVEEGHTVWVYVFSTDDNADEFYENLANGYSDGVEFHLLPDMVLWGEGYNALPNVGSAGAAGNPILVGNPSNPVITLADNNEVMGLTMMNGSEGICGGDFCSSTHDAPQTPAPGPAVLVLEDDDDDILTAYIHHNTIINNSGATSGIHIDYYDTDSSSISGLELNYRITDNIIEYNYGDGVHITTVLSAETISDSTVNIEIKDNHINFNEGDNVDILNIAVANEVINYTINNTFAGNTITGAKGNNEISSDEWELILNELGLPENLEEGYIELVECIDTIGDDSGDGIQNCNAILGFGLIPGSDVASYISGSEINNTYTGNTITNNSDEGVNSTNLMLATSILLSGTIDGNVIAGISESTINNTFNENTISTNRWENVGLFNEIFAYTTIENSTLNDPEIIPEIEANQLFSDASGSQISYIADSDINNSFRGNTIELSQNAEGVKIDNIIEANARAWESLGTIEGDLIADVSGSDIINIFENDVISDNYEDNLHLENNIFSHTSSVGTTINGDQTASVTDSGIKNTISNGEMSNSRDDEGIDISNIAYAASSAVDGDIDGSLTANISGTDIENTISSNEAKNNSYIGIEIDNSLNAESYIDYTTVGTSPADDDDSVSAGVSSSNIFNTLTGNTVSNNDGDGVNIQSDVYAYATSNDALRTIWGDLKSNVTDTDITNHFTGNTIGNNDNENVEIDATIEASTQAWGTTIKGNETASVSGTDISNQFIGNDISGSKGAEGIDLDDIRIDAVIGATAGTTVEGVLTASATNAHIFNTFEENIIQGNYEENVHMDNLEIYASTTIGSEFGDETVVRNNVSSTVSGSSINNRFEINDISGSKDDEGVEIDDSLIYATNTVYGYSSVGGSLNANVDDSSINNDFISNTINSNEYEGVEIDQFIYAANTVYSLVSFEGVYIDGGVSASVTGMETSINNTFTGNDISNNEDESVDIDSTIYASNNIGTSSFIGGDDDDDDVEALVDSAFIYNDFTNNTIENNKDEVELENYIYAENTLYSYSTYFTTAAWVTGNVTASLNASSITNDFTGNTILNTQYDAGVAIDNDMWTYNKIGYYGNYFEDANEVTGDLTSEITDSGITNTFTDNDINYNNGSGVYIYNDIMADYNIDNENNTIGGNAIASMTAPHIVNAFTSNDISGNGGDGIRIYSDIEIDIDEIVNNGNLIKGDILSRLYKPAITNTLTGNTTNDNTNEGIQLDSEIYIYTTIDDLELWGDFNSEIQDASIFNSLTDNTSGHNKNTGILISNVIYTETSVSDSDIGDYNSNISESSITTNLTRNNVSNNGEYGVEVDSDVWIETDVDSDVYGDVSSSIMSATISHTFTQNTIDHNSDSGIYMDSNWISVDNDLEGYRVRGDVSAKVADSSIANTFSWNSVSDNGTGSDGNGDGIEIGYYDDGGNFIGAYNDLYNTEVDDDVIAEVKDSNITNSFNNNTIDFNEDEGVDIQNNGFYAMNDFDSDSSNTVDNVFARVIESDIVNLFNTNSISDNNDRGVRINNGFYVDNYIRGNAVVELDVTAEIKAGVDVGDSGSGITNTFTDNTIEHNSYSGVDTDNTASASSYHYAVAPSVGNDLSATINDFTINNTFEDNFININGGDGVNMGNDIKTYVENGTGVVTGDLISRITDSSISNTFTDNEIDLNGVDGIHLENKMEADYDNSGQIGGVVSDILTSSITDSFTGNSVRSNGDDGIYAYYYTEAATAATETIDIEVSLAGNAVMYNNGYGVSLLYDDGAFDNAGDGNAEPFIADLGGGLLSSPGGNLLYGNDYSGSGIDLYVVLTDSDSDIDFDDISLFAESNWWGYPYLLTGTDNPFEDGGQIGGSDASGPILITDIDFDPVLPALP